MGVAVSSTLLSQRAQFHRARLVDRLDINSDTARSALDSFSRYFFSRGVPESVSSTAAMAGLNGQIIRQSMMLAFNDAFYIMFFFTWRWSRCACSSRPIIPAARRPKAYTNLSLDRV